MTASDLSKEGILLIDKPAGKTSFYLVHQLRRITGIKKIGHAGTLDPFATGVMVMLVGRSMTTQANQFLADDKQYLTTFRLGSVSDTYDRDGKITPTSIKEPSLQEVETVLRSFEGQLMQVPPMYSAKKVQGKKLYELARQGVLIERAPCSVTVHIDLVEYTYPNLTLNITCSKGTYIRSLAHDIGHALQTGAYVETLIRLRSGQFLLEDCLNFHTLCFEGANYTHYLKGASWKSSIPTEMSNPLTPRLPSPSAPLTVSI